MWIYVVARKALSSALLPSIYKGAQWPPSVTSSIPTARSEYKNASASVSLCPPSGALHVVLLSHPATAPSEAGAHAPLSASKQRAKPRVSTCALLLYFLFYHHRLLERMEPQISGCPFLY